MKEWGKAEEAFQNSIQINPFIPDVHHDLAALYEMQGKKGAAQKEKDIFVRLSK